VKPYLVDPNIIEDTQDGLPQPKINLTIVDQEPDSQPVKRGRGRPRKYPIRAYIANISIYLQDEDKIG
jgi:hypothetical protein